MSMFSFFFKVILFYFIFEAEKKSDPLAALSFEPTAPGGMEVAVALTTEPSSPLIPKQFKSSILIYGRSVCYICHIARK